MLPGARGGSQGTSPHVTTHRSCVPAAAASAEIPCSAPVSDPATPADGTKTPKSTGCNSLRNKPCLCFHQGLPVGRSPSRVLLQDLVDADLEGFVLEALADVILVNPELGRCHRFPLRDSGEIKPELSVVAALMVKLSVMLH